MAYTIDDIVNEAVLDLMISEDPFMTESATVEALKVYFSDEKKNVQRLIKEGRSAIKASQYKKALVLFNECKKELTTMQKKLNQIDEDTFDNVIGTLLRGFCEAISSGLVSIIMSIERLLTTRRFRGMSAGYAGIGAGVDYTETLDKRIFQNWTKRECEAAVQFMISSVDKTIVSLNKLTK